MWNERIDEAIKRDFFTGQDVLEAAHWRTCATSELPKLLLTEFTYSPSPKNWELVNLGVDFASAVENGKFSTARALLIDIHVLAAKLLKQEAQ